MERYRWWALTISLSMHHNFTKTFLAQGVAMLLSLISDLWPPGDWISEIVNSELTKQFHEEEIRKALFQMEKTRQLDLMGSQLSFIIHVRNS
jgi:hypothetical protein